MRQFGLIGYPLSHSFSQRYFTEKFKKEGIPDTVFENFSIPSITDLTGILQNNPHLHGFCITIPYKKQVIAYLDEMSEAVSQIGACNCVNIQNGKLTGYNTDVVGFEQSFTRLLQPHHTHALLLGTGGAALGVEYVLHKLGIASQYVSRNAGEGVFAYEAITAEVLEQYSVIINCSPVGTYPHTEEAPAIPYHLLTPKHYLFDLVYNPAVTRFLQLGQNQGATTQNGYDMLIGQAEEAWRIWNS
ncbi:shikimate dehydrogenase family protein [Foetidibacter luteolus]|uniref:shikimate dehydrogenase family protein n=1 Tax=Foetidibacter luteolus TaxID=2608880 RepID=UPI00129A778E|nr:shikimate dehydrogenase [Foetidibacter luteolus]